MLPLFPEPVLCVNKSYLQQNNADQPCWTPVANADQLLKQRVKLIHAPTTPLQLLSPQITFSMSPGYAMHALLTERFGM